MGIIKIAKTIGKGILIPLKWVRNIVEVIAEKPIVIGVLLFIFFGFIVVLSTLFRGKSYSGGFLDNILIEAHGLLFDIFVFGILIVIFNIISERKREIKRYQEEIDDFRGWDEKEATFRIVGNIRRLNKRGVTKINLMGCYLVKASLFYASLQGTDLWEANLHEADLANTNFQGANLNRANFQGADLASVNLQDSDLWRTNFQNANLASVNFQNADLRGANLQGTKNIDAEQLSKVKTLYEAKLDHELENEMREKYPHLLEIPGEEE